MRPGTAFAYADKGGGFSRTLLGGRSARVVVTMGMPSAVYRWFFGAHAVKSLERNVLRFVGVAPVRCSYVGMVEAPDGRGRARWLRRMAGFGRAAR